MQIEIRAILLSVGIIAAACPGLAQSRFDGTLTYAARHTVDDSDNDTAKLVLGYTWDALDGDLRTALELGARNEYFDEYGTVWGAEIAFGRRVGNQRYSLGLRGRGADDRSTTTELGYAIENFSDKIHLRGLLGVQYVAEPDQVSGRSRSSLFGLGESVIYPNDNIALTIGLQGDTDGALIGVGAEWRPRRWWASMFFEWGHAFDDYRGYSKYNDLTAGFRFVPRGQSLKSYQRGTIQRVMHRYVEVQ